MKRWLYDVIPVGPNSYEGNTLKAIKAAGRRGWRVAHQPNHSVGGILIEREDPGKKAPGVKR